MSESTSSLSPAQREQTIQALCRHFADDSLTVEEFERRVELAHRAGTIAELQALLADLPVTPPVRVEQPASRPRPLPSENQAAEHLVAILGGVERKGRWAPARETRILAIMGGAELDFREAVLGPGVTEISVACFLGGVEVIVTPDVVVETGGVAIMGGFSHRSRGTSPPNPDAPVIRITGFAFMGGVDVQARLPGESAEDARRREREERKQRRNHRQR